MPPIGVGGGLDGPLRYLPQTKDCAGVAGARTALIWVVAVVLIVGCVVSVGEAAERVKVSWQPARPRIGDVALVAVQGVAEGAVLEGSVGRRPVTFFRDGAGYAALVGFDMELSSGRQPWRIEVREPGRPARAVTGSVELGGREFPVQRLTLPTPMVDLDPETERRAVAEGNTLRTLYRTITPERFWRGAFLRPVSGNEPGTGFGSRSVQDPGRRGPWPRDAARWSGSGDGCRRGACRAWRRRR